MVLLVLYSLILYIFSNIDIQFVLIHLCKSFHHAKSSLVLKQCCILTRKLCSSINTVVSKIIHVRLVSQHYWLYFHEIRYLIFPSINSFLPIEHAHENNFTQLNKLNSNSYMSILNPTLHVDLKKILCTYMSNESLHGGLNFCMMIPFTWDLSEQAKVCNCAWTKR